MQVSGRALRGKKTSSLSSLEQTSQQTSSHTKLEALHCYFGGLSSWVVRLFVSCSMVGVACNLLLTSNLVSHSLGLNDSDVIDDSLVGVEVLGKSNGSWSIGSLLLTFRSTSR